MIRYKILVANFYIFVRVIQELQYISIVWCWFNDFKKLTPGGEQPRSQAFFLFLIKGHRIKKVFSIDVYTYMHLINYIKSKVF